MRCRRRSSTTTSRSSATGCSRPAANPGRDAAVPRAGARENAERAVRRCAQAHARHGRPGDRTSSLPQWRCRHRHARVRRRFAASTCGSRHADRATRPTRSGGRGSQDGRRGHRVRADDGARPSGRDGGALRRGLGRRCAAGSGDGACSAGPRLRHGPVPAPAFAVCGNTMSARVRAPRGHRGRCLPAPLRAAIAPAPRRAGARAPAQRQPSSW